MVMTDSCRAAAECHERMPVLLRSAIGAHGPAGAWWRRNLCARPLGADRGVAQVSPGTASIFIAKCLSLARASLSINIWRPPSS